MITDTRITIETPEGADLPLDPAGFAVRIGALLIDALIKLLLFVAAAYALMFMGRSGFGLFLIFYFLVEWFYPVVFEIWRNGQTPGKSSMGIAVVNDDGTPVTFAGSLIRNLLRVVDFLPVAYVAGLIACVINGKFKRIGDLAAGTMVIYQHEKTHLPRLDVKGKRSIPADFSTDEQRALLHFAERSTQLSRERQVELANILAPVLGGNDLVDTIKKMANSMLSGR